MLSFMCLTATLQSASALRMLDLFTIIPCLLVKAVYGYLSSNA